MIRKQYSSAFEDIQKTILALKKTLDKTLASIPIYGRSAPEIHRSLKIDRTLAWKVSKLILEDNIFHAATHMPGRAAVSTLLKSLKKNGVTAENLKKITGLSEEFFKQVTIHAGDRASFDMMMLSMSDRGMEQAYQSQQRIQYSANSYLLGIQSKTQFTSWIYHPTTDKKAMDHVVLGGIIDLERKRPKAPFIIKSLFRGDSKGKELSNVERIPLHQTEHSPLEKYGYLLDYCTKPLPEILDIQESKNRWVIQLADGPIGKTNSITLVSANIFPAREKRLPLTKDKFCEVQTRIKTPTRNLIVDVLLHSSLFSSEPLLLDVCQDFTDGKIATPIAKRAPETRIPCFSSIEHIGSGLDVLNSPYIPNYREMVQKVYEKMGWDESEMHLFRIAIEYPVTPSSVYIRIPILDEEISR